MKLKYTNILNKVGIHIFNPYYNEICKKAYRSTNPEVWVNTRMEIVDKLYPAIANFEWIIQKKVNDES